MYGQLIVVHHTVTQLLDTPCSMESQQRLLIHHFNVAIDIHGGEEKDKCYNHRRYMMANVYARLRMGTGKSPKHCADPTERAAFQDRRRRLTSALAA